MIRRLLILILATAGPSIARADTLTLEAALALARGEQPSLRVARADLEASAALIDQFDAAARPTLTASANLNAQGTTPPSLLDPQPGVSVAITARWALWDFGQRARRRDVVVANYDVAEANALGTARDVDREVMDAYWLVVARAQLVALARSSVSSEERHLDEAQRFVIAEARPEIELAQVRSTLAQARLSLVVAENDWETGRVALERAIGVVIDGDWDVQDAWPKPLEGEEEDLDALVVRAASSSDAIVRTEARRDAAEASVFADEAAWRPSLDATATAQASAPGMSSLEGGWSIGLSLSWELWDGGARQATLRQARADHSAAVAEVDGARNQLRADVQTARLAIRGAKARQQAAAEVTDAAAVQLRLAEARYSAGAGSAIELADAQDRVTSAGTEAVAADLALANARTALARLIDPS